MSSERKSFIIHKDSLCILDELTDEQAGKLFKAIKAYHDKAEYQMDSLIKIAMSPFKNQFDRDAGKYMSTVERNRINGLKGGRPKSDNNQMEPKKPSGLSRNPVEAKKADSDSKSDSDSDSKNEKITASRFTPPTYQEALDYFSEKGFPNKIEADKFVDFYEMKGWMVGRTKMKDWKAAVRNWTKSLTPVTGQQQERKKPRGFGE